MAAPETARTTVGDPRVGRDQSAALNFVSFAAQPEYIDVNRVFLGATHPRLRPGFAHLDVATGTGLIPNLLAKMATAQRVRGTIIGVDPDRFALGHARETVGAYGAVASHFVEGFGQDVATVLESPEVAKIVPPEGFDSASIHDAIHEISGDETKRATITAMAAALRPGGTLTMNSGFTTLGQGDNPLPWGKWKLRALKLAGAKRIKGVKGIDTLRPEQYEDMLTDAGLEVVQTQTRNIHLTGDSLEAIARYPGFVDGFFGDTDMASADALSVEAKSQAIIDALGDPNDPESLRATGLPRTWWEVVARKPAGPNGAVTRRS